jgi:transcriptional regulator with XRE-family HTH domain
MKLGEQIRKIRIERGYTLSDVAKAIGVTSGLLSQIENGKTSPSIGSLSEILLFFNVPLSVFFKQLESENAVVVKALDVETIKGKKGVCVSLLASKLENNVLESYRIELTTDEPVRIKAIPSERNGERFLLVIDGSVEVQLPSEKHVLSMGDSINFKSYLECRIKKNMARTTSFFINGTPPLL